MSKLYFLSKCVENGQPSTVDKLTDNKNILRKQFQSIASKKSAFEHNDRSLHFTRNFCSIPDNKNVSIFLHESYDFHNYSLFSSFFSLTAKSRLFYWMRLEGFPTPITSWVYPPLNPSGVYHRDCRWRVALLLQTKENFLFKQKSDVIFHVHNKYIVIYYW